MPLLAASLTSDPRQVSLVSVFGGLPWLLFALHSGALADRWNRLKTMWVCDVISGGIIAGFATLVATGKFDLFVLCLVAFMTGSISTLFDSASQAALPAIVPVEQRARANSWLYTGTVLAGLFIGPPLGSWAYGLAQAAPLWVEAGGFFLSAYLILAMRTNLAARGEKAPGRSLLQDIGEGVRWLWRHRQLRALVVLLMVWNLVENAYVSVLVLYVLQVLQVDPSLYGVMLTGVGVGGVIGARCAPWLNRTIGTGVTILMTVLLTVGATLVLAWIRQPVVAVLMLAVIGFAAFVFNVVSATYRQSAVPDALQGRVNSAYRFATWGIKPLGAAFGGLLAHEFGLPAVFLTASVVLTVIGLITLPQLTNERLRAGASHEVL